MTNERLSEIEKSIGKWGMLGPATAEALIAEVKRLRRVADQLSQELQILRDEQAITTSRRVHLTEKQRNGLKTTVSQRQIATEEKGK